MQQLLTSLHREPVFQQIQTGIQQKLFTQEIQGLTGTLKPFFVAGLKQSLPSAPLVVVTPSRETASKLEEELACFLPGKKVLYFPEEELLPFEITARSPEHSVQRLKALEALVHSDFSVLIVPIRALMNRLIPAKIWKEFQWKLSLKQNLDLDEFRRFSVLTGYEWADLVEAPGQVRIRGGVIDLYPLTAEQPLRIELFGEEIVSMRFFDPQTQRSTVEISEWVIGPAREVVAEQKIRQEAFDRLVQSTALWQKQRSLDQEGEIIRKIQDRLGLWEERLIQNSTLEGLEVLIHFLYPQVVTLLDYLPPGTLLLLDEPGALERESQDYAWSLQQLWEKLLEEGQFLPGQENNVVLWDTLQQKLADYPKILLSFLPGQTEFWPVQKKHTLPGQSLPNFMGQIKTAVQEFRRWQKKHYSVVCCLSDSEQIEHLRQAFLDYDLLAVSNPTDLLIPGQIALSLGQISSGFVLPEGGFALVTEADLFGQARRSSRVKKSSQVSGSKLELFTELKAGDYVVHASHGIGRYKGVERISVAGVQKDYLLVQYAGEDRLYVPTEQVQLLQKYIGVEGQSPKLNKLGGSEWNRTKTRVKQAVQDIAQELIALNAARETLIGFAFAPDNLWQQEFEAAFPYTETPDQLQSLAEIKKDMLRAKPMDRLLCGDVGYGKTEVALRAAFKAVMDSKQVAVLVPTTVLAQQHYRTFQERLAGYPVQVEVLSRFKSPKEQKQILAQAALGQVDILIGTHRLLSADVQFRDLGLLIIDEEQRFGVVHKEKLKKMRQNIDVLTLSATPIPRTLHMALAGVREMSVIETPPEDRFPVQTYVLEYSQELIREAIHHEMRRGGQVFYVHNRIQALPSIARRIQELVPEARIEIAHGQMKEAHLEKIMFRFVEGEFQVLVSTSIVESGLDIPNVNTLIVQDADHLGLAQLYQLRGRVGRSNRLASAYFTYRKDKVITEVATKRLQAIRDFTEFGSGFKIALRDLEIRGAGNLLGAEQHGHMATVGFDMYCRLLAESVQELQGQKPAVPLVLPTIELPVDAYIPDEYLEDPQLKMEVYKKLAGAASLETLAEVEKELRDRFGPYPAALGNLIGVTRLRLLAYQGQVENFVQQGEFLRIRFRAGLVWPAENLAHLTQTLGRQQRFVQLLKDGDFRVQTRGLTTEGLVRILEAILQEGANLQSKNSESCLESL